MCAFLIMSNGWWTGYFAISPLPPSLCINQLPSHLMVTFHPSPGADQSKIRENVRDGVTGHQVWICRKGKRKPLKTHQDWTRQSISGSVSLKKYELERELRENKERTIERIWRDMRSLPLLELLKEPKKTEISEYFIVIEIYSLPFPQLTCSLTQCAALYHHLTLESWDQKPGGEASLSQNLQGWKLASDESAQGRRRSFGSWVHLKSSNEIGFIFYG